MMQYAMIQNQKGSYREKIIGLTNGSWVIELLVGLVKKSIRILYVNDQ
jgi:hypothetical protein